MRPIVLLLLAVTSAVLPVRAQERPSDTLLTVGSPTTAVTRQSWPALTSLWW